MPEPKTYQKYLQQLLNAHLIPFLTELEYSKQKQISKLAIQAGPLQVNIQPPLSSDLIRRYSRQMLLKQISYEGQVRICQAKIALIGSGGIGCPLAMYLSAAGIGTIGLFDSDTVDQTNLHRQIGHRTSSIGKPKTSSLASTLLQINPHISIKQHTFITVNTCPQLDNYDLVIDGSDNPMCRYIVNDYCMSKGRKLLSGACVGWEAQISCFGNENLCYRCLWGDQQVSLGGCSTLGVVGPLPGIVGMILATQAIKIILNGQSSLEGKMLVYDGRKCEFKKLQLRKKLQKCQACGEQKLQMKNYDYARYLGCKPNPPPEVPSINWQKFIENHSSEKILDVRPSNLYNILHFKNSINIPFELLSKLDKQSILQKVGINTPFFVSCARGVMSRHALKYLSSLGLEGTNISGGINGYRAACDPSLPEI